MLPEDEFLEDEYFGEAHKEIDEHENILLEEDLVLSATENDMLELFFDRVRNKYLTDNLKNMYKDEETQFYFIEPDPLDYQDDKQLLPSWFIFDWKYIKIKKNENDSPNPSLPIGELKLTPVPEGMSLRFEAIYGTTNFDLKRFIKNIIEKIKRAKDVKVNSSVINQNVYDNSSPNISSPEITKVSNARVLDKTPIQPILSEEEVKIILSDLQSMRKIKSDYNPETALCILNNIQKGWSKYNNEGGRWGPKCIIWAAHPTSATIGRYLTAFKQAGIKKIKFHNGREIALP